MGQCSSKNARKPENVERFDTPQLDEDESGDDIVEPQLSGPRQQRRAIDERARREESGDRKDFGLTAMRPSLDDNTCTALLALRMGRGSSVGGLLNTASSGANAELVAPQPGAKGGQQQLRPPGLSKPIRASTDSNERLEKVLMQSSSDVSQAQVSGAPQVTRIPEQG